jgi:hypothetical protein
VGDTRRSNRLGFFARDRSLDECRQEARVGWGSPLHETQEEFFGQVVRLPDEVP